MYWEQGIEYSTIMDTIKGRKWNKELFAPWIYKAQLYLGLGSFGMVVVQVDITHATSVTAIRV